MTWGLEKSGILWFGHWSPSLAYYDLATWKVWHTMTGALVNLKSGIPWIEHRENLVNCRLTTVEIRRSTIWSLVKAGILQVNQIEWKSRLSRYHLTTYLYLKLQTFSRITAQFHINNALDIITRYLVEYSWSTNTIFRLPQKPLFW